MTEEPWKATERAIAARLGGRRVPITGRQRGDTPDVAHDWLSIEVKHRKSLPQWLTQAMSQAVASAGLSQLPVVVLHQHGGHHNADLVVLRLSDFRDWSQPHRNNGQKR